MLSGTWEGFLEAPDPVGTYTVPLRVGMKPMKRSQGPKSVLTLTGPMTQAQGRKNKGEKGEQNSSMWWFSDLKVHQNHLEGSLKQIYESPQISDSIVLDRQRNCISHKNPGGTDAAGPEIPLRTTVTRMGLGADD